MKKSILVIGSLNVDYSVYTKRFSNAGETIIANDFRVSYGGKGANQAIAAHKVNGDVYFFGALGSDNNGRNYFRLLKRLGLKCDIKKITGPSGAAFIEINDSGENRISIFHGANYSIVATDIDRVMDKLSFEYIVLQNELTIEATNHIINKAFKKQKIIIYNPAPVMELPLELISKVDYLIINEIEADCLQKDYGCAGIGELSRITGIPHIILTKGDKGAFYYHNNYQLEISQRKVDAIDTVGAGDCFIGVFVGFLSKGYPVPDAIRYANIAASISVTRNGANESYPTKEEVLAARNSFS